MPTAMDTWTHRPCLDELQDNQSPKYHHGTSTVFGIVYLTLWVPFFSSTAVGVYDRLHIHTYTGFAGGIRTKLSVQQYILVTAFVTIMTLNGTSATSAPFPSFGQSRFPSPCTFCTEYST